MVTRNRNNSPKIPQGNRTSFNLKPWHRELLGFLLIFIILLVVFSPMAFQNLRPGGVDVLGSKGRQNQIVQYEKETGEAAYWNPPVFSGMPIYHRLAGKVYSFDSFLSKVLDKVLYINLWIYLIGFIGMYYLLRRFGLEFWASLLAALAFIFIPHYMSLLNIGHFAKFRPIMYMPLVTFLYISFLQKKHLGWLVGFLLAFTVQIRTQHYQIIFYQIIFLLFVGGYYLLSLLKQKQYRTVWTKLALTAGASLLVILMVAQPLFVTGEYTPYSIRGGTGEEGSSGLSSDYATSWSLAPAEILVWFMPRFFGGTSNELYTGSKVAQLTDRKIPGYWGEMPFTETYDYLGIFLLFLGILGVILNWRRGLIKTLLALFVLSLLLAFGRHFPLIYNLFFRFVPAFNKFRVPTMISVLMQIIIVISAGFGLQALLNIDPQQKKKIQKIVVAVAIIFIILGLIPYLFGSGFSLLKNGDMEQYNPQAIPLIKAARLDMMQADGLRLILFTVVLAAVILLFLRGNLKKYLFLGLILIILLFDLLPYVKKAEGELQNPVILEKTHFRQSDTDRFLLQDDSYFRVFPITENPFNNNDWSYYHNSIGGYSAAKLRIYQDIIESCLYRGMNPQLPLNWNIIGMLNTRYIISRQNLPANANLELVFNDKASELQTYRVLPVNQPAWFVNNFRVMPEREKRFLALNDPAFNFRQLAILEKEVSFQLEHADSNRVELVEASFNRMSYRTVNKYPGLLVVSEIYYPEGWECYIDGEWTEIYKTNHVLRSVYIAEPGEHEVEFIFSPRTFWNYYLISMAGFIIAYLLLLLAIISWIKPAIFRRKI